MASHKDNQWIWQGKKFVLKPGQFITSLKSLMKATGCSSQVTRSSLKKFENLEFLTNLSTKTGRLITIVNWDSYQLDKIPTNIPSNKALTKVQQSSNTYQECKNVRSKEVKVQQADFFRNKIHPYFKSIKKSCEVILKLPKKTTRGFNPYQFVNKKINKDDCHPGAVDECLSQLVKNWSTIKSPWSYANIILKTTDGNWWEKEHIQDHQRLKAEFNEYIESSKLKNLLGGIGR